MLRGLLLDFSVIIEYKEVYQLYSGQLYLSKLTVFDMCMWAQAVSLTRNGIISNRDMFIDVRGHIAE